MNKNQKILIVDDEAFIRMLIEQTLEEFEDDGVELIFAENGEEALQMIKEELPDLVFLDVMMPKMNGMMVCEQVKKDSQIHDVYIVLLTAKGQEVDRIKGLEMGADRYMTKPFDPEEMVSVASEILNRSN